MLLHQYYEIERLREGLVHDASGQDTSSSSAPQLLEIIKIVSGLINPFGQTEEEWQQEEERAA